MATIAAVIVIIAVVIIVAFFCLGKAKKKESSQEISEKTESTVQEESSASEQENSSFDEEEPETATEEHTSVDEDEGELSTEELTEEAQSVETGSEEESDTSIGDANVVEVLKKPGHVDARAGILIDARNGQVLFEQDADTALPPASTTKMMTALLTVEAVERGELSLEQIITVDNHARNITPVGGSVLALPIEEGEEVSIKDLLYAVLLKSDCVCCNILAEQVCSDVDSFVERMNQRAKELGCDNTIFLNTHGYKQKGHLISAHDLARIAAEAMQHPAFYEIVNSAEYIIPETNLHEAREIRNTNWLLGTMWDRNVKQYNKDYEYPYAHGVKTGYTEEAGHCLVSYAQKDDMELVCVILGADIDTDENSGYLVQHMYEDTIRLYNWGFGAYERGEVSYDENLKLMDMAETEEETEAIEEQTETVEASSLEAEITESETEEEVAEDGSVARTVLMAGFIAMILMLLAGVAFIFYRKFYYFD